VEAGCAVEIFGVTAPGLDAALAASLAGATGDWTAFKALFEPRLPIE
jgi:hypothetical protein